MPRSHVRVVLGQPDLKRLSTCWREEVKWTCSHCGAINAELAFKCHNCPNTSGDEYMNKARTCPDKTHQFLIVDLTDRCNKLFLALEKAKIIIRQIAPYGRVDFDPYIKEIEQIETGSQPVEKK